MIYLFIVPVLATIKVIGQGALSRRRVHCLRDALRTNAMIFGTVAIFLSVLFFREMPPAEVLIYSIINAVCIVGFQAFYIMAFSTGPISATNILNSFNLVLPLIVGVFAYGESWGPFTIIGLCAMTAAFLLIPGSRDERKANMKWFVLTLCATLLNGCTSLMMTVFTHSRFSDYNNYYIIFSYLFAFVLSVVVSLFVRGENCGGESEKHRGFDIKTVLLVALTALALGAHNACMAKALMSVDGLIFYPVTNVAAMILVTASDVILFRQKLSKKTVTGIIFGMVAIVLLNIG